MIDWLLDDPDRASRAVMAVVIAFLVIGVWYGRKRLAVTLPLAFLFFIFAAIYIPNIDWGNRVANENNCINNLRRIDTAKAEWTKANHKISTDVPTESDLCGTNGFLSHKYFICPGGGEYTIGAVSENPRCSLSEKGHKLP